MKILHSGNGNCYEFDPNISLVREDVWGKHYRGKCNTTSANKNVLIYELNTKHHCSDYFLRRLNVESHFCIKHPNIIPVIDFVAVRDDWRSHEYKLYFIEEEIFGVTLSNFLQGRLCDSERNEMNPIGDLYSFYLQDRAKFAHKVIIDILQGLYFLEGRSLCVRFLEPGNIIITNDCKVKIQLKNSYISEILLGHRHHYRMTGMFVGTLPISYCSPEIICEASIELIDNRSDIYSLGIIFFYLLTGHVPFQGTPYDVMSQHVHAKILLNEIDNKRLREVIKKATEKNPAKRFQSAIQFLYALDERINGHIPWYKKIISSYIKKNRLTCLLLSVLCTVFFCPKSNAQNTMCINYKDGNVYAIPIESIDSITFVEKKDELHDATLIGDWLWGNKEKGYYEVLTFNEDRTYIGYDYYLEYGFDTWTYGTYMANGIMLNLWSNGFGYRRTYRWFVSALTENALEVRTQMGSFTYYRVQPEIYSLKIGEESHQCYGGDYYVFTDGTKVSSNEGRLKGIIEGVSYILKYDAKSRLIMAYKVIVEK